MEALAEAAAESLLDLTPNYDASRHSFHSSVDGSSHGATSSVRHVNNKPLPAQHPVGVIGGGTHGLDPTGRDKGRPTELFDIFTGLIDGISGELLHGTREYVLTGETYEGPFVNGLRQGDGAIARNVFLPYKTIGSTSSPNSMSTSSSSSSSSGKGARFFGTYENDSPRHGTLVVPSLYTYQGPIRNTRPHGNEGTLIKPSGYKYEGSFKRGLYDGTGVETEAPHAGGGVYKGSFQTGQRHGFGEYTISEDDGCGNTIVKYSYKGQWVGNKKQGEGEERICGQEIYRGQFHANERHGSGSLTFESVHRGACQSIEEGDECSCDEHDLVEEGEESPKLPIHGTPTVADGTWRAGQPLDGTHGWTLMFKNGDVYIGYASDFIPSGYGVMRYANKDIYTGQWKDGKRSGEGSFISGNGREEYVGTWKDDKIVPLNEGIKSEEMATFTDMALAVLKHEDDQTLGLDLSSHLSQIADDSSSYQQQREILESIVQRSISNSIERMQDQSITEEQTWSLTPGKARRRKSRRRSWRVELPNQRKMNTLGEKVSSLVDMAKVTSLVDIASQDASVVSDLSVSSDDFSRNTRLKTYKNGDTYYGLLSRNGRRQGYGVYVSTATGSTYTGDFNDDLRQGHGVLFHPLGKYCGEFVGDVKEGEGTLIMEDSSSFFGHFRNNKFHGKGTLCTKDTVYVGDWCDGNKHGNGYETLPNGSLYVGDFIDNRRSGIGTLYERAGGPTIYHGSWENGVYQGEGMCVQRSQTEGEEYGKVIVQYEGAFFNGLRHGFGILTQLDIGTMCKGNWYRDRPISGKWRITYENGQTYSGDAKVQVVEEQTEAGEDEDDQDTIGPVWWSDLPQSDVPPVPLNFRIKLPIRDGFGAMKYVNGQVYIGTFKDNMRHGRGAIFVGGEKIDGIWENDVLRPQPQTSDVKSDSDANDDE